MKLFLDVLEVSDDAEFSRMEVNSVSQALIVLDTIGWDRVSFAEVFIETPVTARQIARYQPQPVRQ